MVDIVFSLQIPKADIWYVQNILETMDGLALVTSANMKDENGFFEVYVTGDYLTEFHRVFEALQEEMPTLAIISTNFFEGEREE
jgi:hypothetical protein